MRPNHLKIYGERSCNHQPCSSLFLLILVIMMPNFFMSNAKVFHLPAVQRFLHSNSSSKFGYSITSFVAHGISQCVVGAPSDNDYINTDQKPGQVYRLKIIAGQSAECWNLPVATDDEYRVDRGHKVPAVSRFLGATVASATKGPDGIELVCDPLHTYFSSALDGSSTQNTIGQCALYTGASIRYSVVDPCHSQEEGSCLAGFSASVMPGPNVNQTSVVLGMPGSYLVEGNVFVGTYEGKKMTNRVLLKASPTDLKHKGFGLGYAVTIGNLLPIKDKRLVNIVASSPVWKDNGYRGIVIITNREMNLDQMLYINDTVGHVGSYFGYCLEIGDFNGDSIGDIVVSAPYYSNVTIGGILPNIGQVYIFYGGMTSTRGEYKYIANADNDPVILQGTYANGRFGHSLATLGDIDSDGLDDLAVGCPYCGPEKTGAVYIFSGSKSKKLEIKPIQVIFATDINLKPVDPVCPDKTSGEMRAYKGFGWSMSGKYDMDGNEVPDLMVGDYQSAQVTMLRSRVSVWLSAPVWKIDQNATIPWTSVKNEKCGSDCRFNFSLEVTVNGISSFLSDKANTVLFDVIIDLDSLVKKESDKRLVFHQFTQSTKTILQGFRMEKFQVGLTDRRRIFQIYRGAVQPDYFNTQMNIWLPIVINITVIPREHFGSSNTKLPWLLHPRRSMRTFLSRKMLFQNKECGVDNICRADLYIMAQDKSLGMRSDDTIYFKERGNRNLTIWVGNIGENAYSTKLKITMPYTLLIKKPSGMKCVDHSSANGITRTLTCALKNPFPTIKLSDLPERYDFQIDTAQAFLGLIENKTTDVLSVDAEVISGNQDSFQDNNKASITYKIRAVTNVAIAPYHKDPTIVDRRNFSLAIKKHDKVRTKSIGPNFEHIFLVTNTGPSTAEKVYINIDIPVETEDGYYLVYLLDNVRELGQNSRSLSRSMIPKVVSKQGTVRGSCSLPSEYINPLFLNAVDIDRSKKRLKRSVRQLSRDTTVNRNTRSSVIPTVRTSQQEKVSCQDKSSVFGRIKCVTVTCEINNLTHNDAVRINVHGWLWADTFFRYRVSDVIIHTDARGWVDPVSLGVPLSGNKNISELTIARNIVFEGIKILVMKQIPFWYIALAIILGLITLALIIIAMWRCGFFERNRVGDIDEVYM